MIKFMDLLILILRCCYFGGGRLSVRSTLRRVVAIDIEIVAMSIQS